MKKGRLTNILGHCFGPTSLVINKFVTLKNTNFNPTFFQVLPKLSSSIVNEVDSILGNKPYSKKDYRS